MNDYPLTVAVFTRENKRNRVIPDGYITTVRKFGSAYYKLQTAYDGCRFVHSAQCIELDGDSGV